MSRPPSPPLLIPPRLELGRISRSRLRDRRADAESPIALRSTATTSSISMIPITSPTTGQFRRRTDVPRRFAGRGPRRASRFLASADVAVLARGRVRSTVAAPSACISYEPDFLHIATSVGLFFVFVQDDPDEFWPSMRMVAALFAVHPMHVESVAWAKRAKDVLSTFFLMLTIAAHVEAVRRPKASSDMLSTIVFLHAFGLPGETDAGHAAARIASARRPAARAHEPDVDERVAASGPSVACPRRREVADVRPRRSASASHRAASAEATPAPLRGPDYLPWQPRIANVSSATSGTRRRRSCRSSSRCSTRTAGRSPPVEMIPPFVVLAAITIGFVLLFRKHPRELLIGWLLVRRDAVSRERYRAGSRGRQAYADRFAYVPHIGLFVVLSSGEASPWPGDWRLVGEPSPVLPRRSSSCTLLGPSFRQVTLWRDTETLFRHALAIEPDNSWLQMIFGEYYWFHGEPERPRSSWIRP